MFKGIDVLLRSSKKRRTSFVINRTIDGNQRLLTTDEIAERLKVSLNTVQNRRWQKRSGCPLFKVGKRIYTLETTFWKWVADKGMLNERSN